jgi:hypothetical protein
MPKPASHKQCLLLFIFIVSGLTVQADIVRALEKVIHSLQASKRAKDLSNPPSHVAGVCVSQK